MLDWSQKRILRFRNRCGISENAMDIFIIFGRVAALGHTYFRVLCCSLSMFLASVFCTLALHLRCGGSQGLWVLRAHGASTSHWWYLFGMSLHSAVAKLWQTPRRQSGLALSCSSLNEGGKHLTGTLFLHLRVEVTVTGVKSISGLLNVAFTSTHYCHILCGMIPDPNWFRSRGVDPTFLIMYEHKGGLTPSLFAKNVWELGGGNPSKWGMYECQMLEMYYW